MRRCCTPLVVFLAACAGAPKTPAPLVGSGYRPPAETPPEKPTPAVNSPPSGPAAPTAGAGLAGPRSAAPKVHALQNQLPATLGGVLPNGDALLVLGLGGGTDQGLPGVAELAAETLVASGDAGKGRPSLRQTIEALGGTLRVDVGAASTWVAVTVPAGRWAEAQRALAKALAAPNLSRHQLERIRDDLVSRRIAAIWTYPDREAGRVFLLGDRGTDDHLAALLDRDVSEIVLFQSRFHRPADAFVACRVPADEAAALAELNRGLGTWQAGPGSAPATTPTTARRLTNGMFWVPSPVQWSRATLVLPLPEPLRPEAVDGFVAHALLTLDGAGGRFGALLRERNLGQLAWRTQLVHFPDRAALVATTELLPDDVPRLWDCFRAARESLRDRPPTADELAVAKQRARLTARLGATDAVTQARDLAALQRAGIAPERAAQRLAEVGAAGFDATAAIRAQLAEPVALVVFGGTIPATAADVTRFELLPAGAMSRLLGPDPKAQAASAKPWLEPALETLGGKDLLARLDGCTATAVLTGERTPELRESVQWDRQGNLQRSRQLLGATIDLQITPKDGNEAAGAQKVILAPRERAALLREIQRHPVLLLAAHARGELQFRPVAQRPAGDREVMILEALGDRFDRLRVHVDTRANLIRTVEVWETTADGTVVHIQDAWSDYRTTGGLRAPFRRITTLDDGQHRVEAAFDAWTPRFASR